MKKVKMMTKLLLLGLLIHCSVSFSQEVKKLRVSAYDGTVITGYVDHGAFLNFTGPNINASLNNSRFVIGMLPSVRFRNDSGTTKDSFITPNLGIGFTYSYKIWAIQIPFYYNSKTATTNGKWNIGLGIGLRLDSFNKVKK